MKAEQKVQRGACDSHSPFMLRSWCTTQAWLECKLVGEEEEVFRWGALEQLRQGSCISAAQFVLYIACTQWVGLCIGLDGWDGCSSCGHWFDGVLEAAVAWKNAAQATAHWSQLVLPPTTRCLTVAIEH